MELGPQRTYQYSRWKIKQVAPARTGRYLRCLFARLLSALLEPATGKSLYKRKNEEERETLTSYFWRMMASFPCCTQGDEWN